MLKSMLASDFWWHRVSSGCFLCVYGRPLSGEYNNRRVLQRKKYIYNSSRPEAPTEKMDKIQNITSPKLFILSGSPFARLAEMVVYYKKLDIEVVILEVSFVTSSCARSDAFHERKW